MGSPPGPESDATDDTTVSTYEQAAEQYRENLSIEPAPALRDFYERIGALLAPGATVLELGSGTGRGARQLESMGYTVRRTDATEAFLSMMRADGFTAQRLDIRTDPFGGPYDLVFADAVLLHLSRDEFARAVASSFTAVTNGGLFAFTVKEGDGSEVTTWRLDRPRHFTYWREPAVRDVLTATGWDVLSLEHVQGPYAPWLHVIARRRPG